MQNCVRITILKQYIFYNAILSHSVNNFRTYGLDKGESLYDFERDITIVDIGAYCLMPNHFHILLQQLQDNGISTFVRKLLNSYTRYFNTKNERIGPLFQGQFKAVRVESDEQLLHLTRYIHLNPLVGYVVKDLRNFEWSSYLDYIKNKLSPSP